VYDVKTVFMNDF